MAKSSSATLDQAVAQELGKQIASRALTLKHVQVKSTAGEGFYFLFQRGGLWWLDLLPVWRDSLGVRMKPPRLIMPAVVHQRLKAHVYKRWYFVEGAFLYPVQMAKVEKLHDGFWFVTDPSPLYHPLPLLAGEPMHLRKKSLRAAHPQLPAWPTPLRKSTVVEST